MASENELPKNKAEKPATNNITAPKIAPYKNSSKLQKKIVKESKTIDDVRKHKKTRTNLKKSISETAKTSSFQRIKKNNILRYVVTGGASFGVELAVLYLLKSLVNPFLAISISFAIGFIVSYILQKYITFSDKRTAKKIISSQIIAIGLLTIVNYGFTMGATALFAHKFDLVLIRVATMCAIITWNYAIYKYVIFNQKLSFKPKRPKLSNIIFALSLLILSASTCWWSWQGAGVHSVNADQYANSFQMESVATFRGSELPPAHTFLLKWPVFFALAASGNTALGFMFATTVLCLATVWGFAFILYKIERRPLRISAVYLTFSSVLLAVPAQPYPGGLLPVNMGMVTTRNIEYLVLLFVLYILARHPRLIRIKILALAMLSVLFASDKLFLTIVVGGFLTTCALGILFKNKQLLRFGATSFIISFLAASASWLTLLLLTKTQIVHITQAGNVSPFAFTAVPKTIILNTIYAVFAIFTNTGANPFTDMRVLRNISNNIVPPYALAAIFINFVASAIAIGATIKCFFSLTWKRKKNIPLPWEAQLCVAAISMVFICFLAFIATGHYAPVDARYLGLCVFAGILVLTLVIKQMRTPRRSAVIALYIALFATIICGIALTNHTAGISKKAYAETAVKEQQILTVLHANDIHTIVGDYWRVYPIKANFAKNITAVPLESCNQYRDVLASRAWKESLYSHNFSVLVSNQSNLTNSSKCSVDSALKIFGEPSSTILISDRENQQEQLLLYKLDQPKISTNQLIEQTLKKCASRDLNIVAHQDDDILFMNPDIAKSIAAGGCNTTIYVTAGDSGQGKEYYQSREKGTEVAYSEMLAQGDTWIHATLEVHNHQLGISYPKNNPRIQLIYLRLPDGNLRGQGFDSTKHASIEQLYHGNVSELRSVDNRNTYTKQSLQTVMESLIGSGNPSKIRIQTPPNFAHAFDHSDHMYTALVAYKSIEKQILKETSPHDLHVLSYADYEIKFLPENLDAASSLQKKNIFAEYMKYDNAPRQSCRSNTPSKTKKEIGPTRGGPAPQLPTDDTLTQSQNGSDMNAIRRTEKETYAAKACNPRNADKLYQLFLERQYSSEVIF